MPMCVCAARCWLHQNHKDIASGAIEARSIPCSWAPTSCVLPRSHCRSSEISSSIMPNDNMLPNVYASPLCSPFVLTEREKNIFDGIWITTYRFQYSSHNSAKCSYYFKTFSPTRYFVLNLPRFPLSLSRPCLPSLATSLATFPRLACQPPELSYIEPIFPSTRYRCTHAIDCRN